MPLVLALLHAQAADEARGLAIDSITKAASGHMGLPLGCAEIGAVLFGQELCAPQRQTNQRHAMPPCSRAAIAVVEAPARRSRLLCPLRAQLVQPGRPQADQP